MVKRLYPRVEKSFSAVVENIEGLHLKVLATDASVEGLCIQCNTFERNLITPGGSFVANGKPVELFVWLELPFANGKAKKVAARCNVSFSRRISKDQCQIGMRYTKLEEREYQTLINFIESSAASNDD